MNLKLLPPKSEYAELFSQWRNEPNTLKFNPIKNRSVEDLREMLGKGPTTLNPLIKDITYRWFIEMEDKIVGSVSLANVNLIMKMAEVGYMVGEKYQGRGIASAALRMWTTEIFKNTELRKLTALAADPNIGSVRVLEKAGYRKEGFLLEHYIIRDEAINHVLFGLLRSEWETSGVHNEN